MTGQPDRSVRSYTMKTTLLPIVLCMTVLILNGCRRYDVIRVNGVRVEEPDEIAGADDHGASEQSESVSGCEEKETDSDLAVYVCGAVRNPSVCRLEQGSRVCDAIEAAGGFSDGADTEWLNQAQMLQDAQMIVVYTKEETAMMRENGQNAGTGMLNSDSTGSDAGTAAVNLNSASEEQLMALPGIGESKAESIIRYREENGPFSCIEDVMNISGIKDSVFSKIKDYVTV